MIVSRRCLSIMAVIAGVMGMLFLPATWGDGATGNVSANLSTPIQSSSAKADVSAVVQSTESLGTKAEGLTWKQLVESGGWLMYVLGALSVLTVAFVIYFFVVLRTTQVAPRHLYGELIEKIKAGAIDDARRICEYRPCPLSAVAIVGLNYVRNSPEADPVMLKDVIESEGGRQAEAIQGHTQYLLDIAVISPMVGFLGTVFGMLRAFGSVALDIAKAKPVVLASGIAQALVTTAFGLLVSIPAMMFYAYFRRRSSRLVSHLETVAADVLTVLLSKRS